jgi:hypothetical protein
MSKRPSAALKRLVAERARDCCEYCRSQARFATEAFSVEHIQPEAFGGETVENNLALACQGCNNSKFTKTAALDPVSGQTVPLFNPRTDKWSEHFVWNDDFTLIIGLTPTGRATVETLNMNRHSLVNLRRILFVAGKHPVAE